MSLPESLLNSLSGIPGYEREAFEAIHHSGQQVTSIRLNPLKPSGAFARAGSESPTHESRFTLDDKVPWSQYGYYLPARPSFTFDPLFHAGCYYVQEASSMFLEQALVQTTDLSVPLRVLDLCAAPGGKSTHLQSLLHKESLLVSNEVIKSRVSILRENLLKWGGANRIVTQNDPADFGRVEDFFDVIVVDAPCSGSGLFRRDPDAIQEWSQQQVLLCSQRQRRILADVLPALRPRGVLIYSTCSYSREENEEIAVWLAESGEMEYLPLHMEQAWPVLDTGRGYRFWPHQVRGEGFYISCFRKKEIGFEQGLKTKRRLESCTKQESRVLQEWVSPDEFAFVKKGQTCYAWPAVLEPAFNYILEKLHVVYSGIRAGELIRDKLVPDAALALSGYVAGTVCRWELNESDAIRYLQRKDLQAEPETKGWQLITHKGFALGWINALPNRINNYFPREWRILKESL